MLSNTCKYGIRAVIFIAAGMDRGKVGLKLISDELNIPQPYLAKILQTLTRKRILDSSKGPHGGFSLMKPPEQITLMDIIKAIDGDDYFDSCFMTGGKCSFTDPETNQCLLHNDFKKEKQRMTRLFRSKTIQGLLKQMKRTPALNI